jgi:hypothetical protein
MSNYMVVLHTLAQSGCKGKQIKLQKAGKQQKFFLMP